jgi:hypothetical protein
MAKNTWRNAQHPWPHGNVNKKHIKIHLAPARMTTMKNKTATNVGEDVGKKKPSYTVSTNVNC